MWLKTKTTACPPKKKQTKTRRTSKNCYQQLLPTMSPDVELEEQLFQQPSLLSLPPHIRHHIYLCLGVARFDGHACVYCLDGRKESRRHRSEFDRPPTRNFTGLLLSCRTLYTETAALLYSAN